MIQKILGELARGIRSRVPLGAAAFFSIASAASTHAQSEFVVRQWTQEHGIPQSTINAIAQDHSGYLWLGTFGGLSRFDGVRFVTFDQSDVENSCPNRILDLKCGRDGSLWIASEYAGLWRHHEGRFERWLDGTSRSIAIALDGSVYVVSVGRLFRLAKDADRFELDASAPVGKLKRVKIHDDGALWVCSESGTYRRDGEDWTEITYEDGRSTTEVSDIAFCTDGTAYLRVGPRIDVVAAGTRVLRPHLECGTNTERLLCDRTGTLWTSSNDDLVRFRGTERLHDARVLRRYELGSKSLRVRSTFEDSEGGLWFGTESTGLFHVQPSRLEVIEEEASNLDSVGPILADGDGEIWVGATKTIARYRDGRLERVHSVPSTVRALAVAKDGALWASGDRVIYRAARGAMELEAFPLPEAWSKQESALRTLWFDEDGALWAGGSNGLYRRRDGRFERWSVDDGLNSNEVFAVKRDSRGDLWIGTDDGICRMRDGAIESFLSRVHGIPVAVRDIEEDADHALWLATYGAGLCRFENGVAEWYTTADGLPDNSLSAVVLEPSGRITVTTNRGVATSNITSLTDPDRKGSARPSWSVTTTSAYRPVVEAQGGVQPSALLTADGTIVFTVVRGIGFYRPEPEQAEERDPIAHIEELRIGTRAHRLDEAELPLGARRVTFGYTAPRFISPGDVRFRYRLLPVDQDWIAVGTAREATYQLLGPGRYEFEVSAGTARTGWSSTTDRVEFTIPAQWHETEVVRWTARITILAAILVWFWSRSNRQKRHALKLGRLVDERTRELAGEIEVRKRAEAEIRKHHDDLDARVRARTSELEQAYRKLEAETAERTRLHGELLHSQKMDSLGRMASGVAHDFNNLLTAITGSAEIGDLDSDDPIAARRAFAVIRHASEMAAHLTRQLLIFARRHPMSPIEQTFERRVLDTRALLERALGERYTLALELCPDPCPILLPEGQVEQLLMNVCLNARDAMKDGGTITIRTARRVFSDEDAPNQLSPGEFAELAITDTGIGMDPETVDHAFDPFFTTKTHGSGLGLSTCYGLARQAGGTMKIESAPGRGTTMYVWLPRARSSPTPNTKVVTPEPIQVLDILLVEDRAEVRGVVAMMLGARGHRVVEATSGVEALAIADDHAITFDVVVLDVMMPGLTGPETAARIRARRPQVAIVFMSGNVDSDRGASGEFVPRSVFLAKPFTAAELDDLIDRAVALAGIAISQPAD